MSVKGPSQENTPCILLFVDESEGSQSKKIHCVRCGDVLLQGRPFFLHQYLLGNAALWSSQLPLASSAIWRTQCTDPLMMCVNKSSAKIVWYQTILVQNNISNKLVWYQTFERFLYIQPHPSPLHYKSSSH